MKLSCLILLVAFSLLGPANTGRGQAAQPASITNAAPESKFATVYVYRLDRDYVPQWINSKNMPINFGEHEDHKGKVPKIGGVKDKRYFVMHLSPGIYKFDTLLMNGNLSVDVVAGETYYLRADKGNDCGVYPYTDPNCQPSDPSVELISVDEGKQALAPMTPIGADHVKDWKYISIPAAEKTDHKKK